jgi:hypothetical protein
MNRPDFQKFPKIPRLMRDCVITEKIDGTNGVIWIAEDGITLACGSRNRWLTAEQDNFGFFKWVESNFDDLLMLGPGYHYGEWWGQGIQRRYGLDEKRFSLFNVHRWGDEMDRPLCCDVVPILHDGVFTTDVVEFTLEKLAQDGSSAAPGFMDPEGIVIWHQHARCLFKYTLGDDGHKG